MKDIAKLMDYRKSIRVLDATLRDGGLVNDFFFSDEFVKALYQTNIKAGVDYMEIGYKASKDMFDESKFGIWKFCDDDAVRKVIGDNENSGVKLAVMADVGRCDYKNDIHEKAESPIDMVRVATYLHTMPAAVDMIEDAVKKGYETTCNIMAVSAGQESDIKAALDIVGKSPVEVIYVVDSYGSIYPEAMARLADIYLEAGAKYGKKIGIHAHNNMQLAFANTIEVIGNGVDYADATYACMGRGAGNCSMELLLGFLKNPKYDVYPAVKFVQNYMKPLIASGLEWGCDLQYMLTGMFNQHPRTAIAFTKEKRTDYAEYYKEIMGQD